MISGSQQHGASGSAKFGIKVKTNCLVWPLCHCFLACIQANLLTRDNGEQATGGWAFKYADLFKEKLGISLDKADEMDCLVAGINFLLKVGS